MGRDAADRAAEALLRPDPVLGVPIPAYDGRSLPNVTSSLVRALGHELTGAPAPLPPLAPGLDPFEGRRAEGPIVLFLVDGLGWYPSDRSEGFVAGGFPAEWSDRLRPIASVFPTTTTVALTSLSAGQPPSRHGIVGHRVYLPAYGAVTEVLRMSPIGVAAPETLTGPEWRTESVSGAPNIFRRGLPGVAVSRDRFEGTGFTRILYEGAEFVGFSTAGDLAHRLAEVLRRPTPPPLILAYWDELDTVEHLRGPRPELASFEAGLIARILAAAADRIPPERARDTTVLITSDHGQVSVDRAQEIAIDREPSILPHLWHPPGGDRRAGLFAARPGELDSLRAALQARLPPGAHLLSTRAAVERGLFGPPPYHPELLTRLGDLLVLLPSPASLTYRVPGVAARAHLRTGAHGGLEPEELLVPLATGRLSDLLATGSGR